mgnify:CR=1 FL=1
MKPTHINELFCTLLEREKKQDSFAYRLLEKHSNPERVIDVKNDIKELQGDLDRHRPKLGSLPRLGTRGEHATELGLR